MAHATHFLSRLDRLAVPEHVEVALALYRDTLVVKRLLALAKVPEGGDRVALELSGDEHPPCLVLSLDGGFITCLGPGMRHDLPRLSVDRLEQVVRELAHQERTRAFSRRLTGADRPSLRYVAEVLGRGALVTRAEILALSAWGSELGVTLLRYAIDALITLTRLNARLARIEETSARHRTRLEERERQAWAAAHALVLSLGELGRIVEEPRAAEQVWEALQPLLLSGIGGVAARAFWVVARLGKPLLRPMKAYWADPSFIAQSWASSVGLTCAAVAHDKLKGEVLKALERGGAPDGTKADTREVIERYRSCARGILHGETGPSAFAPDAPEGLSRVPEEQLPSVALRLVHVLPMHASPWEQFVAVTAVAIARFSLEEIYLPDKSLQVALDLEAPAADPVAQRFECFRLFDAFAAATNQPPTVAKGEGRNAPCPCGRGKKRKRCCGTGRSASAAAG